MTSSYILIFIFGTIIGSFLNVVLYRMHTGKSLNGRSHCMSCRKELEWYELFPVFSYLSQRGKCRGCLSYIPSRYLFVELATGLLYCITFFFFHANIFLLLLFAVLNTLFMLVVVYDIRHTIIPDELSLMIGGVAVIYLGYVLSLTLDWMLVGKHILAGLSAGLFFWGLWFVSKGRWIGLGDAKLALPLGMIVGLGSVFSMVVLSFWIGAVISVSLLGLERVLKRGKIPLHFMGTPLTIKSEVPFAPFMIVGFLLVQLLHADIFNITYVLFFS